MVDMIQKSWQLTKSLYNSGPHFTWVRWKFLQIFFIFFNPYLTYLACITLTTGVFSAFLRFIYQEIHKYT